MLNIFINFFSYRNIKFFSVVFFIFLYGYILFYFCTAEQLLNVGTLFYKVRFFNYKFFLIPVYLIYGVIIFLWNGILVLLDLFWFMGEIITVIVLSFLLFGGEVIIFCFDSVILNFCYWVICLFFNVYNLCFYCYCWYITLFTSYLINFQLLVILDFFIVNLSDTDFFFYRLFNNNFYLINVTKEITIILIFLKSLIFICITMFENNNILFEIQYNYIVFQITQSVNDYCWLILDLLRRVFFNLISEPVYFILDRIINLLLNNKLVDYMLQLLALFNFFVQFLWFYISNSCKFFLLCLSQFGRFFFVAIIPIYFDGDEDESFTPLYDYWQEQLWGLYGFNTPFHFISDWYMDFYIFQSKNMDILINIVKVLGEFIPEEFYIREEEELQNYDKFMKIFYKIFFDYDFNMLSLLKYYFLSYNDILIDLDRLSWLEFLFYTWFSHMDYFYFHVNIGSLIMLVLVFNCVMLGLSYLLVMDAQLPNVREVYNFTDISNFFLIVYKFIKKIFRKVLFID